MSIYIFKRQFFLSFLFVGDNVMSKGEVGIICRVKQYRQQAGLSQSQLAKKIGVKRQAIYDIESGRYLPNTSIALRLAKHFGCRVEDLFLEEGAVQSRSFIMAEGERKAGERVSLAKVRSRLVGYPLEGIFSLCHELRAADGILDETGFHIRLLGSGGDIENSVLLLGCDPAFSLLAAHVARIHRKSRIICRFASSHSALNALAAGRTHIAGTHLHSTSNIDSNVMSAKEKLTGIGGMVVGFSLMEEGLMVAPGNPLGIRSVADLAGSKIRLVNREPGAALRVLLDDELAKKGIPHAAVRGYDHEVQTHNQGAQMVACNAADAALGLCAIARAFGLNFVPITEVRCDLVIPADLVEHPTIQLILDVIQTRDLRDEIGHLPGYSPGETGKTISSF
jgi:molybdate-binding protein/DNA-binding XRE family transcriptional regulator